MGGTAAAPIWMTMRGMYDSTACAMLPMQADRGRPDQEAPEEPDGTVVVLRRDLCLGRSAHHRALRQFLCDGLPAHRHDQAGLHSQGSQVCAQSRQEHVGLPLDPADLSLTRCHRLGQFHLGDASRPADLGQVDHHSILLSCYIASLLWPFGRIRHSRPAVTQGSDQASVVTWAFIPGAGNLSPSAARRSGD